MTDNRTARVPSGKVYNKSFPQHKLSLKISEDEGNVQTICASFESIGHRRPADSERTVLNNGNARTFSGVRFERP